MSKPKFNPNLPYEVAKPAFDPNQPFEAQDEVSELESGLRGVAQGATFGFSDEITGALESMLTEKTYKQARDESRKAYEQAQEQNPYSYGTGQIGGAVATALIPGLGEMNLAKAAAMGGVQALGDSTADNTQDMALDVAKGGALGAGTFGVLNKVVAPAAKYVSGKISEKAPNVMETISKKVGKGIFGVDEQATENYLKNSVDVNNSRSMGELADSVLNRADDASAISEMRSKASELSNDAWATLNKKSGITKKEITDAITNYIDDPKAGLTIDGNVVGNAQELALRRMEALKKQIDSFGAENISEENLKRIISNLDDNINWNNPEQGPTNDAIKSLRTFIDTKLKTQNPAYKTAMEKVEEVTKAQNEVKSVFQNRMNPESYDKFNKAVKNLINKDEMSSANQAVNKIQEHTGYDLRKDITNSWTKAQFEKGDINGSRKTLLGGVIGTAAGSVVGAPTIGGAVGGAVGFTADRYAGPIFKKVLDGSISANQYAAKFANTKFAKVITDAASRGNSSLAATHFLLSQTNPDYRKMSQESDDENQ